MEDNNTCRVCGNKIEVQIQKNTGFCCAKCEKKAAKQSTNAVVE